MLSFTLKKQTSTNAADTNFKTKWHQPNIWKVYMQAIMIILRIFIRGDNVTYVKRPFNHLKLYNFLTLWKMIKNALKLCQGFAVHEIN